MIRLLEDFKRDWGEAPSPVDSFFRFLFGSREEGSAIAHLAMEIDMLVGYLAVSGSVNS